MSNVFPEIFANSGEVDESILDYIMQQSGSDRDLVQFHVGQNIGNFERMDQIGFPGRSFLSFVFAS